MAIVLMVEIEERPPDDNRLVMDFVGCFGLRMVLEFRRVEHEGPGTFHRLAVDSAFEDVQDARQTGERDMVRVVVPLRTERAAAKGRLERPVRIFVAQSWELGNDILDRDLLVGKAKDLMTVVRSVSVRPQTLGEVGGKEPLHRVAVEDRLAPRRVSQILLERGKVKALVRRAELKPAVWLTHDGRRELVDA